MGFTAWHPLCGSVLTKGDEEMDWQAILGWGSPMGLGLLLLGLGVFFWGFHYQDLHRWGKWTRPKDDKEE